MGDQALLLSSRARWAARCVTVFGARTETEALQGRERVGGKCRNSWAAATTVAIVAFARVRARTAGVWSQKN